jgi:putative cardiolipin synthase
MKVLAEVRRRNVRVRLLTNSLESTSEVLAQAGYMRYRVPALEYGVELFEARPMPDGYAAKPAKPDAQAPLRFALHAKIYVFDRRLLYIGSMNFDQRSFNLNTEAGLLIHSPELAGEAAARFETMAQAANSYKVSLRPGKSSDTPRLRWSTQVNGKIVDYDEEPDQSQNRRQRVKASALTLLPLEGEL